MGFEAASLFMLVGLLLASPWVPPGTRVLRSEPVLVDLLTGGMLLTGLWQVLWHGLPHLGDFWGAAALVSGAVMVAVALLLGVEHGSAAWRNNRHTTRAHAALKPLAVPLVVGLALCLAVYAVALVRLQLGLPIPT